MSTINSAITVRSGQAGRILAICFFVWGVIGLIVAALKIVTLPVGTGVAETSYLTAAFLVWIGGMILFGLGAILVGSGWRTSV